MPVIFERPRRRSLLASAVGAALLISLIAPGAASASARPVGSAPSAEQVESPGAEAGSPLGEGAEDADADAGADASAGAGAERAEPPTPDAPRPDETTPSAPAPAPAPTGPSPSATPVPDPAPRSGLRAAGSEQSALPAPPSRAKRIIGAVHTDAVSVFLDAGRLALDSAADIDVDGDGRVDLGSRLPSREQLFHLADESRVEIPADPRFAFLGAPGSPIWLAPQTQDPRLIWPGFSTEHASLAGRIDDRSLHLELVDATGPGHVEVYLQDGGQPRRTFSSEEQLAPWRSGVPQHTHMNWVFTEPGRYDLTFRATATVDGREQQASQVYTFVVGDLAASRIEPTVTLSAARPQVEAGADLALASRVSPEAEGAVQIRDLSTGSVLGHSALAGGEATLIASDLTPGSHRLVAEFVPTWSTDAVPASSSPVDIEVAGESRPRPDRDDTTPVGSAELAEHTPGTAVRVLDRDTARRPGAVLPVVVEDAAQHGRWVSAWIPAATTPWRGWVQAGARGSLSVDLPSGLRAGTHQIVLESEDGALVGWDRFTIATPPGAVVPPPPPAPAPAPAPAPIAPAQSCVPSVVLETGHVDAFNVSAADGRAVLQIKEDVTGLGVLREPESVLLRVKESAYQEGIPASHPGSPRGWVLPFSQSRELLWPGWDTNRTAQSGFTDVRIRVTGVAGPGSVHLYSMGSFGDVRPLLEGGATRLPGTIHEPAPAHTHAQWSFSERGIYRLTADAVLTSPASGQSIRTAPRTYVFQVGDVPLGDAFCGLSTSAGGDAARISRAITADTTAAVAAEQAAAEAAAEEERQRRDRTRADGGDADETASGTAAAAAGADPAVLVMVIAGGVLLLLGIALGTIWYVRRLGRTG